ncbi:hypothetical protein VNI00_017713 [Paramarasmius palmivorus]|uniref:Uncharacterized protein n=1 Tax=Paramarasmius palmivorus TaxID=297713 RepID=A0AAW0B4B4_9AGAR
MTTSRVWYLLVDHKNQPIGRPSKVSSLGIEYVVDLKEKVKENAAVTLKDVAASQLEVWRCTNQEIQLVGKDTRVQEIFSKDQVVYLNEQQEIAELQIKAKEILFIRVQALVQKLLNDNSLNNYWPYRMHKLFWGKSHLLSQAEWEARPLDWLKSTNWHLYRLSYYEKLEERIKTIKQAGKEGVVILGNPGAGKSSFLEYLYIRSLCNKEDVVFFFDGTIAIHTEEKCYVTNIKSLPQGFFEVDDFNGVTLLIEWNKLADPPAALVRKGVRLFAVQATSPREERYRWIEQRPSVVEVVVDLPSNEDFYKILPTHTRANVDAAIAKWGRDIRKIQKALTDGERSLENTVKTALDRMTLDDLLILSKNPSASPLCFSHGLIATAAQTLDRSCPTDSDIMVHFITSPYICRTFLQAIVLMKKVKLEQFFFMLRCDTSLGATRGIVFENLAHEAIINRGKFEEFFNRLVESYPRTLDGRLGTISGYWNPRYRQYELLLLRTLADYPIRLQKIFPDKPLLSLRFRNNVELVLGTMNGLMSDGFTCLVLNGLMACPPAAVAYPRDLSCITNAQLWAVVTMRMEFGLVYPDQSGMAYACGYFDRSALDWLRTGLAFYFRVNVLTGNDLYSCVDCVTEALL